MIAPTFIEPMFIEPIDSQKISFHFECEVGAAIVQTLIPYSFERMMAIFEAALRITDEISLTPQVLSAILSSCEESISMYL